MNRTDQILISRTLDKNPSLRGTLHLVEGRERLAGLINKPVEFVGAHLRQIVNL